MITKKICGALPRKFFWRGRNFPLYSRFDVRPFGPIQSVRFDLDLMFRFELDLTFRFELDLMGGAVILWSHNFRNAINASTHRRVDALTRRLVNASTRRHDDLDKYTPYSDDSTTAGAGLSFPENLPATFRRI